MYHKGGKVYADWFDIDGVRRRKSFERENEALAHEHLQAAIKHAIKLGREERAMELWHSYDAVEQVLQALAEAAGWLPFTLEEVEKSIDSLARKRKPAAPSRLAGLSLQLRRKILLDIILSAVVQSGSAEEMASKTSLSKIGALATDAAFVGRAAN